MNYKDLVQQNNDKDKAYRLKWLSTLPDAELVGIVSSAFSDVRDVRIAAELLRQHGVTGLPQ